MPCPSEKRNHRHEVASGKAPLQPAFVQVLVVEIAIISFLVFLPREPRKDMLMAGPQNVLRGDCGGIVALDGTNRQDGGTVRPLLGFSHPAKLGGERHTLIAYHIRLIQYADCVMTLDKSPYDRRDRDDNCRHRFFGAISESQDPATTNLSPQPKPTPQHNSR